MSAFHHYIIQTLTDQRAGDGHKLTSAARSDQATKIKVYLNYATDHWTTWTCDLQAGLQQIPGTTWPLSRRVCLKMCDGGDLYDRDNRKEMFFFFLKSYEMHTGGLPSSIHEQKVVCEQFAKWNLHIFSNHENVSHSKVFADKNKKVLLPSTMKLVQQNINFAFYYQTLQC